MTIDDIKTYLRVDHDDDENFKASADMAKLAIIAELYENRNEAKQDDYSFTIRSMITQLQYWE